ncbi:MAG: 3-phosphoshikimate 1-carboxyvinyltransferase, partial [Verrucomicrobiales bacterium]
MTGPDPFIVQPIVGTLDSTVILPGSKSLTNRALIVAALADGTSVLRGVGLSDDTEAMMGALRGLGIQVEVAGTMVTVHGRGGRVDVPAESLDANMSGTSARFLLPMLAVAGAGTLTGHAQMRGRPMADLTEALRGLGAALEGDALPITVGSGITTRSVSIGAEISSQFISGLLLSAPAFPFGLELTLVGSPVSQPYIDMTIAVMHAFGAEVDVEPSRIIVAPVAYKAIEYLIEPDASTASYPLAAAAIVGGRVTVAGLGSRSVQGDADFANRVLSPMGASVFVDETSIEVRGSGNLDALTVDLRDMSDTAPTFAALAAKARGKSSVHGIGFIRTTKESDRVQGSVDELRRLGIAASVDSDGFSVVGGPHMHAAIETSDDHRMAMGFALIGLTGGSLAVDDPD